MNYRVGFVGCGNMGSVLAVAAANVCGKERVCVVCSSWESTQKKADELGLCAESIGTVCEADYVFLAIKPQKLDMVATEMRRFLSEKTVVVSMLAGVSTETLSEKLNTSKIIRIMPNTPAAVGEGMTLVCKSDAVTEAEYNGFSELAAQIGKIDRLPEEAFDAGSALSGCGPAYMYLFLEALADGAVKCGLPRAKARLYAAQTMLGAAKLALSSEKHTAQLKDEVCSPGGTTIEGVLALENGGLRAAAGAAVVEAYQKTQKLAQK